ncbi:MAG: hypothetical protein HY765_08035 [Rhodomicrobium sp.]|nr:hypothetical protein [Rhodomicrobium sp.]
MTKPVVFISENALQTTPQDIAEIEQTLGMALREFASELRLVDAADFAAFIRIGHMPNLKSIVQSSAELHFKPGTLELAEAGEVELGWFAPPLVTLPMKFRNGGVRVYFRLRLGAVAASVEVESIAAEDGIAASDLNQRLREALEDARIVRIHPAADS